VKAGDEVVEVKVDESEVNVVVEDENEVVVSVVESTIRRQYAQDKQRSPNQPVTLELAMVPVLRPLAFRWYPKCGGPGPWGTNPRDLCCRLHERSAGGRFNPINRCWTSCQSKMMWINDDRRSGKGGI
jgi:hypothetical protein